MGFRPPLTPIFFESNSYSISPEIQNRRSLVEREATGAPITSGMTQVTRTLRAFCYVCGPVEMTFSTLYGWQDVSTGQYVINWREHLICPNCGLNNRMRATIHLLEAYCSIGKNMPVYITEQSTRLYSTLRSTIYPNLVGSEFLGEACVLGSSCNGMRNEDMTRLTFADGTMAGILSFDVLEHIPDYGKALKEVYRCLMPGGAFVFSAPFDRNAAKTLKRAEVLADGSIRHLLPPEYHGDPVRPNDGILCYQTFGWDLLDMLRSIGFEDVKAVDYWSRDYGYLGGCLIFMAHKPSARAIAGSR